MRPKSPHLTEESVQFSHSIMSNSLRPQGLQHACFPVHHQLPELAQTHIHQVGGAIQPSNHLSSTSPPAFNLYQHQGLFQWISSSHQVAKVLEYQLQHQYSSEYSGLISFRIGCFDLLAVQHHNSKSSSTPQFKSINSSVLSFLYGPTPEHTWLLRVFSKQKKNK